LIDGLAVVDKPSGWTSHDVVARCRRIFGQRKVGHSGTLDPSATGLLLVGLGRVTRLLPYLSDLPKSYVGEVVLGSATSTLDDEGEVTGRWDMRGVSLEDVKAVAPRYVGAIEQVPPMVSAVKVGGMRLHQLARAGAEVAREAREVVVHRLEVSATGEPGVFRIEVDCSSGTYVRSLAADLGESLGGGAHLRNLRRVAIGSFTLAEALALDELSPESLLTPASALRDYPGVTVGAEMATAVSHGRVVATDELGVQGEGPWAVLDDEGRLLAVYEGHGPGRAKPAVVVTPAA
jgi:tRNA pseudouridine55 synthase